MDETRPQWVLTVSIYHGPTFGHSIELDTVGRLREEDVHHVLGRWHGVGMPDEIYRGALASVDAVLGDYLVTRYGVVSTLEDLWGGGPEPF